MEPVDGGWEYLGQSGGRLWDKSAIGRADRKGGLILCDSEVIFCHDHRNLEWPNSGWLSECISSKPEILFEAAVLEALRVPGNKVVFRESLTLLEHDHARGTWGLRWTSNTHPNNDSAMSEVRWFHASDKFDAIDLYHWCASVTETGRLAEILVVDDEHSVVTYRLHPSNPEGNQAPPTNEELSIISAFQSVSLVNGGAYFSDFDNWPSDVIGIPVHAGRQLGAYEIELVLSSVDDGLPQLSDGASILQDLYRRGLHSRPGFKYGTRWRCYERQLGKGHAPWLVVNPVEASQDWGGTCLASRLASGVNKHWLHPISVDGVWRYLEVARPPPNSRWSNPSRK
jgi:hypothetical protein